MKTKQQIKNEVQKIAQEFEAKIKWGTENCVTTLTLSQGKINPKLYEVITKKLSQKTGVDCYFTKCTINSIEVLMDAKLGYYYKEKQLVMLKDNEVPENINKNYLYGKLLK